MEALVGHALTVEISQLIGMVAKNNPFALVAIVSATLEDSEPEAGSDQEADAPTETRGPSRRVARPMFKSSCLIMDMLMSQWRELATSNFASFVDKQVAVVGESKIDARRCGVIAPVLRFPSFVQAILLCENGKNNRLVRSEIEKMGQCLFTLVKTTAQSNSKYTDVVITENAFHLWWHLTAAQSIVTVCQELSRTAFDLYTTHSRKYSEWIVHCQFESVIDFFRELESFVGAMDIADIMFQERFSKNAFRDLMETHLGALAVRKSVTQMRKRVEKHISAESGLKTLAWKLVSERFLEMYRSWEGLVATVYRPATLGMRVDDLEVVCGLVQ